MGYKNERYLYFGARGRSWTTRPILRPLAALLLAGAAATNGQTRGALRIGRTGAAMIPISAQTEAVMAGAGRAAGRPKPAISWQAITKAYDRRRARLIVEPGGHPAGKPDAVIPQGTHYIALLACARAGIITCRWEAVTEGENAWN